MGAPISAADRKRLEKLLGMLGSSHPGERDNAAVAVARLVQARGLTWPQVLNPPAPDKPLPEIGTWRATVTECLSHPGALRKWEIGFLQDLSRFHRISVKQRYCLKEIADRVLERPA